MIKSIQKKSFYVKRKNYEKIVLILGKLFHNQRIPRSAAPITPEASPSSFFKIGVRIFLQKAYCLTFSSPMEYSSSIWDNPPPMTTAIGIKHRYQAAQGPPKIIQEHVQRPRGRPDRYHDNQRRSLSCSTIFRSPLKTLFRPRIR